MLNILVLSNYYPPHNIGGYELGCRDVVRGLEERGHRVTVLTSTYGDGPGSDGEVHRRLTIKYRAHLPRRAPVRAAYLAALLARERRDQRLFRELAAGLKPDLLYVWNASGISISLLRVARSMGIPTCVFVSDEWLARFPADDVWVRYWAGAAGGAESKLLRRAARALGVVAEGEIEFPAVQFASRYLLDGARAAGRVMRRAEVVHWGVDTASFPYRKEPSGTGRRLLFVGQIMPHKGVHTAIEALRLLRQEAGFADAMLDLVGGSTSPEYVEQLRARALAAGLADAVRFVGGVPREELRRMYHEHDVLIFPSIWPEPFSITVVEAMASGIPVVGTPTGGSPEILVHEENALLFAADDAAGCAAQTARLLASVELRERLRAAARAAVESSFTLSGEASLSGAVAAGIR